MARIRKFAAYHSLERPYTRVSKFTKKNFVRGGFPQMKIVRFEMGNPKGEFDTTVRLNSKRSMNIRHNAFESARMTSNGLLERNLGKEYHLKIKVYPFHVLRENPLAAGAGADRMSTGMKKSFGKSIGSAARVKEGQTIMEVRVNKENIILAKEALKRASKKFPCSFKIVVAE
ncbi:50S ribosomal protein L16 [Candidatus Woesearchaeota archaeon]|nr:50S ribosomal protein L16 [Candidatus Woesearchaeota archaeon]